MLPQRSGFLVLEKLQPRKQKGKRPFVIMVTGNEGKRHEVYAKAMGVDEYLNKPFRMDRLIRSVETLLGAPSGDAAAVPA
jgi:DNA-binding response OmpR family regulator